MAQLKIGVFGAGRGADIARNFMMLDCEIVAICDFRKDRLEAALEKLGKDIAAYESFDAFIEHDMDAVILANCFHEHTPYVIRCFEKNIHVFCECISNGTMAEGVALVRAYEKTRSIFMLAENYPQMKVNLEMQRLCKGGTLGKILYAEGEYNHPGDPYDARFNKIYNYYERHWRNFNPAAYYITHSLGPLMRATGATPRRVTAFGIYCPGPDDAPSACFVADRAAIVTMHNDDGSVFRVTGCATFGGHHNAYRICGTEGQVENLRDMSGNMLLRYNAWSKPADAEEKKLYEPGWNDPDEALIEQSGHDGGDFITARMFVQCIRDNCQPPHPFDVHGAVAMSSVAILGHRSALEDGKPYDIPDFTKEECRQQYENDWLSPYYGTDGKAPTLPCCTNPNYQPNEVQLEKFNQLLQK